MILTRIGVIGFCSNEQTEGYMLWGVMGEMVLSGFYGFLKGKTEGRANEGRKREEAQQRNSSSKKMRRYAATAATAAAKNEFSI